MNIDVALITGVSLGFEYISAQEFEEHFGEDIPNTIVIDLFIFRFIIEI